MRKLHPQLKAKGRFFQRIYHNCRKSRPINNEMYTQYLMDLYDKQHGFGYYSGMKMICTGKTDWKASIERLKINDRTDYTKDNVVLECHEFNGSFQFDAGIIAKIPKWVDIELDFDAQDMTRQLHKLNDAFQNRTCMTQCILCGSSVAHNYVLCKKCKTKHVRAYRMYQFILGRWRRTKQTSHERGSRRGSMRGKAGTHAVSMREVIDNLSKQDFRDYYCGIPLIFTHNSARTCSAERLVNTSGYDDGNLRFCVRMFNS